MPTGSFRLASIASADDSVPLTVAPPQPQIALPSEATRIRPERKNESRNETRIDTAKGDPAPPKREVNPLEEIDRYLWEVYQREPVKRDSSGDFTWKDPAAAKKRGMSVKEYAIGGMDPDFREQLYHAGHALDAQGLRWSMLSAFRDDYRQALASGFKARPGNSLHGGSNATGGYGHGRAIDVTAVNGDAETVWRWFDAHGAKYGIRRPMPGYDPAHIQAGGAWHEIAQSLRNGRTRWPTMRVSRTPPRRRSGCGREARAPRCNAAAPVPSRERRQPSRQSGNPSTMYCRDVASRSRTAAIFT